MTIKPAVLQANSQYRRSFLPLAYGHLLRRTAGQILLFGLCLFLRPVYADWVMNRPMAETESVKFLFPASDRVVWSLLRTPQGAPPPGYSSLHTQDGGKTWISRPVKGLAKDFTVFDHYDRFIALTANKAMLTGTVGFTGKGPGLIYRTADGGKSWHKVFTHDGNCQFHIGMVDYLNGIMALNYDFFDHPGGRDMYVTHDGGETWSKAGVTNPSMGFINALTVKNNQIWLQADSQLYYSDDLGATWDAEEIATSVTGRGYNYMAMMSRSYGIANASNLLDLFVKRPENGVDWHALDPKLPTDGALQTLLLVGDECWFSMPLDTLNNYYSNDRCVTFKPFMVSPNSAFTQLAKAWRGSSIWAATDQAIYRKQ